MGAPKKLGYRWDAFDYIVFFYLMLHVPTTLLIDAQAILPAELGLHPPAVRQLLQW